MRASTVIRVSAVMALIAASVASIGAAPVENGGKGPIDKTVFVHYPKHEQAKGKPGSGGGGTGTLSPTYKYTGVRWAEPVVTFYVNPANSGNEAHSTVVEAVKDSFDTWSGASGPLEFKYEGETTAVASADTTDDKNVVSWGNLTTSYPNAIAVTFIWSYRYSRAIVEVDTIMNNGTGFEWSYTDPNTIQDLSGQAVPDPDRYVDFNISGDTGRFDIRNIMTHEAGHWLMLGDLYNSRDSALTMYGYGSEGETRKDTLGYGDELGVEKAYGP